MNTDFIIILDPEIDEETGELILVVSKLSGCAGKENMGILGAFIGDRAKELVDLFLNMKKDKEE